MRYLIVWLCQLLHLVTLSSAVSSNWTKPNGQAPSFTDTYTVGERIFVSWLALNNSLSDLWLTRYDPNQNNFSLRLQVAVNISISGSYPWTIGVDADEVTEDTRFILQFLPTGAAYDTTKVPELPSPAFNLISLNQAGHPNGTVGAPSISPTISATANAASLPSASNPTSQPSNSQLPDGDGPSVTRSVAIGVAIGAAVLALASMIGAIFVVRAYKRRKPSETDSMAENFKSSGPYEVMGTNRQPTELSSKDTSIHELNHSKETMIFESPDSPIYEMSTTVKRPGLHEMPG